MKLINVVDLTSATETTIKVDKIVHDDETEIVIHQISGTYHAEKYFDSAWDLPGTPKDVTNFISLNLLDAGKLINALLELTGE